MKTSPYLCPNQKKKRKHMATRKQVMQKLVIEEATNLRNLISEEESENLDFRKLKTTNRHFCIYGQLTGDCDSRRAIYLMKKCASRVYKSNGWFLADSKVNGSPEKLSRDSFWSPIEVFIVQERNKSGNNEALIKFLKKETDELKFV